MNSNKFWAAASKVLAVVTVTLIVTLMLAPRVAAQSKYKVLHRFHQTDEHPDGTSPYGGLVFDAAGNLYGTTFWGYGGGCMFRGCGSAF